MRCAFLSPLSGPRYTERTMSRLEEIREELYRKQATERRHPPPSLRPPKPNPVPSAWDGARRASGLLERAYLARFRRRRFLTIALTTAVFVAISFASFYGYTVLFGRADVEFEIVGPHELVAGEATPITVRIANRSAVTIRDSVVTLTIPTGAVADGGGEASPGSPRYRMTFDAVLPQREATQEVRVRFLGATGATEHITGLLLYRPENITSKLTHAADFSADIVRVPVAITVSAPERVNVGEQATITIGVDAESEALFPALSLGIEFPAGFAVTSADPPPLAEDSHRWLLADLAVGTPKTVTLHGQFTGEPTEVKTFQVRVGRFDPIEKAWLVLTEATAGPTIASPLLLAQATLNGDRNGGLIPGAHVSGTVFFKNNLADKVQNVTVTLALPEQFVDLGSIQAEHGFYDVTRRLLTWDPASEPRLKELDAGEEGILQFSFNLRTNLPIRSFGDKNFVFPVTTAIDTGTPPPAYRGVAIGYREALEFKIISRLTMAARAAYYESPVPNTGPLPPRARRATSYTVFFQLGSGANDIHDVVLRASLAGGVEFKRVLSNDLGAVEFNPASQEILWRIGSLPAATGILRPHAAAAVGIVFTPAENQIGDSPALLTGISASGRDSFSGTDVDIKADNVTTEIRNDSLSKSTEWRVAP